MKRMISLALVLMLTVSLLPAVHAGAAPAVSSNIDDHFYINAQRWTDPIRSTLAWEDGGFLRVEAIGETLVVERYDAGFQFLSGQEIPLELPLYGGVYLCDDYNFLVVGQENYEEDDAKEVFRIIRYTKDWQKVDHASLFGANTTVPFDAGCCRFDRCGDILYIRTAHEMYASEDGYNHQANVMIAVRISDMTVTDELTKVWNNGYGYVSHSFNQFVRVDGDKLLAVDHGDAHPRSVCLFQYPNSASSESFYGPTTMVNALPIVDSTYHYNDTGVSVGGFEFSSTDYLIAGCSYDQVLEADLSSVHRNIFVTATPKDDFTDEATVVHWLTDFTADDDVTVSPPHLLKLDADRFFLTWTENGVLKYCLLNGKGEPDGEIRSGTGNLSDCQPIMVEGRAVWYVTDNSAPVFYEIDPDNPFTDVGPREFYYEPVLWAVENGITTGATPTTFNPLGQCQRAQVVTFLWRATGEPEPATTVNPFEDVKEGKFYYKAVLWAVENGITNGLDATHFGPYAYCNRAQVVTFLWRSVGHPGTDSTHTSFTDVKDGEFYYEAVLWAVENSITNGMSDTEFGVNAICNRAQIVTFLYRAFA